jgi:hypothetical protein
LAGEGRGSVWVLLCSMLYNAVYGSRMHLSYGSTADGQTSGASSRIGVKQDGWCHPETVAALLTCIT